MEETQADQQPGPEGVFAHVPVLAEAVAGAFADLPADGEGILLDCTLGGGGHAALLLAAHPQLRLIGLDQDPAARAAAAARLAPFDGRVTIVAANFGAYVPPGPVLGVLADLGVSSPQLEAAGRGFGFRSAHPPDMRMNPEAGESAAALLDRLGEAELADLIHGYGEERLARRIARRLVAQRPWSGGGRSAADLAHAVAGCYPPRARHGRIHPATRTFQALRIAVNDELGALDRLLQAAPDWLVPGGILAVISFHSLEDRRVKTAFRDDPRLERITRKPLMASEAERGTNPRSRSARLRVARRPA
ncbi:MAG: 16S rRNA (cytosine(1402)-N(4))-methyltransferase RsmH [Synechococcaceae cyanobacterium]|nr:16S rRNA (cytosine(1402)-N(4))-methyltransferase RsmH [Synechococcaceae cyanobacterium]